MFFFFFKQKTAYEILSGLVGSEMCIRDSKTIERPDIREDTSTTDNDTPKFFHYVKKDHILDSAVNGKYVVALCGETFPVTKQAKPGSPVCPDCERVYKGLRRK